MRTIKKINSHIGTLERRLEYLEDKVGSSDSPNSFDQKEAKAMRAALTCMRYARVLQTADPVAILRELIEAEQHGDTEDVAIAIAKAQTVIKLMETANEEDEG